MASSLRGPYRSVYDSIWNDPDFTALGQDGQQVWYMLRHRLGMSGIDLVFLDEFFHRCFTDDRAQVDRWLELLREHGWIEYAWVSRSGVLVWMRKALDWEPSIKLANSNHVDGILRHLLTLPRHEILRAFLEFYGRKVAKTKKADWSEVATSIPAHTSGSHPPTHTGTHARSHPRTPEGSHPRSGEPRTENREPRKERRSQEHVISEQNQKDPPKSASPNAPAPGQEHGVDHPNILDQVLESDDPRRTRILNHVGGLRPEKPAWIDELLEDLANPYEGVSHLAFLANEIRTDHSKSRDDWIRIVQDQIGSLQKSG